MQKMPDEIMVKVQEASGHIILMPMSSHGLRSDIQSDWFESKYWIAKDRISGQSKGRHITWFINAPDAPQQHWVLRHYYRGGLVAKINNDQFLFTGLKNSRCYRELRLLQQMSEMGLPVPKPIAARLIRKGLFYRADLLMEKLEATDLLGRMRQAPVAASIWEKIGSTIATFHSRGVYHADLNIHNILLDPDDNISVIDFDRCDIRTPEASWQLRNMQRLHRSLQKEIKLDPTLHLGEQDWQSLNDSYLAQMKK